MMSTVSLNGLVGANTGGGGGGRLLLPCAVEPANEPAALPGAPEWPFPVPPFPGPVLGPVPITAGIVVIVVTVEELELVLAFMLISMLDSADDTCSRFSMRI